MSFLNVYYKRTAGTAKACYMCYKPTTTVLATMNNVDFFYICLIHLTDPGFGTVIQKEGEKPTVSPEEIAKMKAEWEEKQKQKEKLAKEKAEEKDKDKDKDKETDKKESKKEGSKSPKPLGSLPTSPPPPATPTHEKYELHQKVFAMRNDAHRRRRQATQAKELAPRLPGAPQGGV